MLRQTVIALVVAALAAPAAAQEYEPLAQPLAPITLAGQEVSRLVEVWTLQEPAAAPAEEEREDATSSGPPIAHYALYGAFWGCVYGFAVGNAAPAPDIRPSALCVLNGMTFAGIATGIGALVKWTRKQDPVQEPAAPPTFGR